MKAVLAVAWLAVGALSNALPAPPAGPPVPPTSEARTLIEGCLADPTTASVARLASAIGAIPYSDVRTQHELARQDTVVVADPTAPGQADPTVTTLTSFHGWDLPGAGAGSLEYTEDFSRQDKIDQASGGSISAVRVSRSQTCHLEAPVVSGRAMFELFETLEAMPYGILVSPDRLSITVFIFDPGRSEIDFAIVLEAPLAGVPPARPGEGNARLVMDDGGPRFQNGVIPGVPTVRLTRAQLLAAIDRPATMSLANSRFTPIGPRLSRNAGAYPLAFTGAAPST